MPDNLEQEVKQLLSRLTGLEIEEIGDTDDLISDLGIDSLKIIEIATEIERKYKVATRADRKIRNIRKDSRFRKG